MNLCPECGNPPAYTSFCTLCAQLFRAGSARRASEHKCQWRSRAAELAALHRAGLTHQQIAAKFGVSVPAATGAYYRHVRGKEAAHALAP